MKLCSNETAGGENFDPPAKNFSEQSREPTNSTTYGIKSRTNLRIFYPLCQPCGTVPFQFYPCIKILTFFFFFSVFLAASDEEISVRNPAFMTTAALTHACQLVEIMAFYLDVNLPKRIDYRWASSRTVHFLSFLPSLPPSLRPSVLPSTLPPFLPSFLLFSSRPFPCLLFSSPLFSSLLLSSILFLFPLFSSFLFSSLPSFSLLLFSFRLFSFLSFFSFPFFFFHYITKS